jgi:hypothetical protein
MVLANLVIRYFGSVGNAIEALCLELLFFYFALLAIAASVAVFPVGDQQTSAKLLAAKRAQSNARGSLLLTAGVGVLAIAVVDLMVLPIWSTVSFEFQFQRLKWGNIDVTTFLKSVDMPASSIAQDLDVSQVGIVGDHVVDARSFLHLFSRDKAPIQDLDLRSFSKTAVIAAREVVFDESSFIRLGSKDLVILTDTLQLIGAASRPQIYAYRPDDVPSNEGLDPGSQGRAGANAGSVTIVVMSNIKGGGLLKIDLSGQRGGKGARGLQPDPQPQAKSREPVPGRPKWSYRKPEDSELQTFSEFVATQLVKPDVDGKTKAILKTNETELLGCRGSQVTCRLILCDERDWGDFARGRSGERGLNGKQGGKGGKAGDPGILKTYFEGANSELRKLLLTRLLWPNDVPIDRPPPPQLVGEGGDPGRPGLGGAGGQGLVGDPFGVCQSGAAGESGALGDDGSGGDRGSEAKQGAASASTALSVF